MAIGVCARAVQSKAITAKNAPIESRPVQAKDCPPVVLGAFSGGFSGGFS